ncbi:MAG TPA: VacJ family lipoprotein [Burkholderiaceae bacterium]|nr:VacJ family lipoprotein [Burkholderiaceae bacterium]
MNASAIGLKWLCGCAIVALLGACASVPPDAGKNPIDPFERVNRQVFSFNDHFDRALVKPAAKGYTTVIPKPVRACFANFFDNLFELTSMINSTLQGKPKAAGVNAGRFLMNSTVGVLGCFDVATHVGLEHNKQYFALTMGHWGIGAGPYLVLPFLGPSSVRDAFGEIPDYFTDPMSYITPVKEYYLAYSVRFVDKRAQLLEATNLVEEAALDPYQFVRDAYLQRTRSRISGDSAPPPPEEEDPDNPSSGAPARNAPAGSAPMPSSESLPPAGKPPEDVPATDSAH